MEEPRHEQHPLANRRGVISAGPGQEDTGLGAVVELTAKPVCLRGVVGLTKLHADLGLAIAAALGVALLEVSAEFEVATLALSVYGIIGIIGEVLSQRGDDKVLVGGAFAAEDLLGSTVAGAGASAREGRSFRSGRGGNRRFGDSASLTFGVSRQSSSLVPPGNAS